MTHRAPALTLACRRGTAWTWAAPRARAGPHEQREHLLAGPELQRLVQRGRRQVHRVARVAHERGQRGRLRARVEAVAAGHQKRAGQKVLRARARGLSACKPGGTVPRRQQAHSCKRARVQNSRVPLQACTVATRVHPKHSVMNKCLGSRPAPCTGSDAPAAPARLRGRDEDLAVLGRSQVVHDAHEQRGLCARLLRLRHVHVHLVAVKVRIVRRAHALVEAEGPARATRARPGPLCSAGWEKEYKAASYAAICTLELL